MRNVEFKLWVPEYFAKRLTLGAIQRVVNPLLPAGVQVASYAAIPQADVVEDNHGRMGDARVHVILSVDDALQQDTPQITRQGLEKIIADGLDLTYKTILHRDHE